MKDLLYIAVCRIMLLLSVLSPIASAKSDMQLSVSELAELVKANELQYQTINAEVSFDQYKLDSADYTKRNNVSSGNYIYRYADGRSFTKTQVFGVGRHENKLIKNTLDITSQNWQKSVNISSDKVEAIIKYPKTLDPRKNCQLRNYIWDYFGQSWGKLAAQPEGKAYYDSETKLWVIEIKSGIDTTKIRKLAKIDPEKNFMPTRYEIYRNDELIVYREFSKYTQIQELWFPTEFLEVNQAGLKSGKQPVIKTKFTVNKINFNQTIPVEQLDFVLPAGTLVEDRIAGLTYKVGEAPFEEVIPPYLGDEISQTNSVNGDLLIWYVVATVILLILIIILVSWRLWIVKKIK